MKPLFFRKPFRGGLLTVALACAAGPLFGAHNASAREASHRYVASRPGVYLRLESDGRRVLRAYLRVREQCLNLVTGRRFVQHSVLLFKNSRGFQKNSGGQFRYMLSVPVGGQLRTTFRGSIGRSSVTAKYGEYVSGPDETCRTRSQSGSFLIDLRAHRPAKRAWAPAARQTPWRNSTSAFARDPFNQFHLTSKHRLDMPGYKVPKRVELASALPRTPSGKLMRRALR